LSTSIATPENLTEITGSSYQVQKGDTLFAVAFYSGNTYRELAKINSLVKPYKLTVGQSLRLSPNSTALNKPEKNPPQIIVQNSNKIGIDPKRAQAYGNKIPIVKPKPLSNSKPFANIVENKLSWMWPAVGNRKVATVGSDGSKRGVDIKGKSGDRIFAAADGKVVYAGNALKGYGNLIIVKHNDDYLSAYAHNKSILIREQTYVKQGQQIATMGSSGASDIMLHFEIRRKGKSVDPFRYLPAQ